MNTNGFKLVTSNTFKLNEYQRFGLELGIEKGKDLKEVDADEQTVILYKSLEAGAGHIVEDTSLMIEGADVGVNVRWLLDTISDHHGKKAVWNVWLGKNDGKYITLYKKSLHGIIVDAIAEPDAFGFDPYFQPEGSEHTLYQLEKQGNKDLFSPRKWAAESLLRDEYIIKKRISDIPEWTGSYQ